MCLVLERVGRGVPAAGKQHQNKGHVVAQDFYFIFFNGVHTLYPAVYETARGVGGNIFSFIKRKRRLHL